MAAYVKFNVFVDDLCGKVHDLKGTAGSDADTLRVLLTNASPNVADTVVDTTLTVCRIKAVSNADEISAGNGYTKKGESVQNVGSAASGTFTLSGTKVTWTASGGSIGPFRYVVLYNDTAGTTSARPVIAWWDYGSSLTLNAGETFSVKFNGSDTQGTIFTLA